jgi:predicted NUDIX family NTP pyrophosphohydrolase
MPKVAAGLLMVRRREGALQFFLAHPGGPFWAKKDAGAWSIVKGEVEPGEELFACALREFAEETGLVPTGPFQPLGSIRQKSGKTVHAWAFEGDWPDGKVPPSNLVTLTIRGRSFEVPEIDRVAFFHADDAKKKLNAAQVPFIERSQGLVFEPTDEDFELF